MAILVTIYTPGLIHRVQNYISALWRKLTGWVPYVAILVEHPTEKGYYLAVSRPGTLDDFNFPGGHVEEGETALKAALRELLEETAATAKDAKAIFTREEETAGKKLCTIFQGTLKSWPICGAFLEAPKLNSEGCVVKWTTKEGLCKGSFSKYNLALFKKLGL